MSWAIEAHPEASPPWAKWVDMAAASAWLAVMRVYMSQDVTPWAHGGGDTPTQFRKVRDYFQALRGLALALNVHPCDVCWYSARRVAGDPGELDLPGLYTSDQIYLASYRRRVTEILARRSEAYREAIGDGPVTPEGWREAENDIQVTIWLRIDFDASGAVVDRGDADPPGAPASGFGTWSGESDRIASDGLSFDPPNEWQATKWNEFTRSSGTAYIQVYAPLEWSYQLARAAMADCISKGLVDTVAKTIAWGGIRNARIGVWGGGDGIPDEVVRLAASYDAAAVTAPEPPAAWRATLAAMTSIAAATLASGVGAPLAAVMTLAVGLLFGVPELLNRLFAAIFDVAVGRGYDCWMRRQPYLIRQDLTGDITSRTPPAQVVPPAPVYTTNALPEASFDQVLLNEYPAETVEYVSHLTTSGGGSGGIVVVLGLLALLLSQKRKGA